MAYLGVDELAGWLRIKTTERHPELERAINSAEADIDKACGWGSGGFAQGDVDATARYFRATNPKLLHLPIGSGIQTTDDLEIATDDNDDGTFIAWTAADYELLPLNQQWAGVDSFPYFDVKTVGTAKSFPIGGYRAGRVRITAKWGWASPPVDIIEATKLRAAQLHMRSNTADGVNALTGFRAGGRDRDWEQIVPTYAHPGKRQGFA